MMDEGKKKSMAALIVSGLPPKKVLDDASSESDVVDDESAETGLDVAAEEAIAAFESRDPQALKEALKSFIDMCR